MEWSMEATRHPTPSNMVRTIHDEKVLRIRVRVCQALDCPCYESTHRRGQTLIRLFGIRLRSLRWRDKPFSWSKNLQCHTVQVTQSDVQVSHFAHTVHRSLEHHSAKSTFNTWIVPSTGVKEHHGWEKASCMVSRWYGRTACMTARVLDPAVASSVSSPAPRIMSFPVVQAECRTSELSMPSQSIPFLSNHMEKLECYLGITCSK